MNNTLVFQSVIHLDIGYLNVNFPEPSSTFTLFASCKIFFPITACIGFSFNVIFSSFACGKVTVAVVFAGIVTS